MFSVDDWPTIGLGSLHNEYQCEGHGMDGVGCG